MASEQTLYTWLRNLQAQGVPVPGNGKKAEEWSSKDKFGVVLETAGLNEAELAEYCRRKGLFIEQIVAWRTAALQSKLATIEEQFPFEIPPIVTMIEVSFDGYLADPPSPTNRDHLAALAARMAYRLAGPVSNNRRIYRDGKGSPTAMPRTLQAVQRKMAEGWNVGLGDKTGDQYQHCYLKTTDYTDQSIPTEMHRARFEIRLAGAALPNTDVASWKSFKFEKLAPYINFRKEDPTAGRMQQIIIAGLADRASQRKAIPRKDSSNTLAHIMPADTELNQIVKRQLQHLTRRWSYMRKSAQISTKK